METSHSDEKASELQGPADMENTEKQIQQAAVHDASAGNLVELIADMKKALSGEEGPNFKKFFDARKAALPLFKTQEQTKDRQLLWKEFTTLSEEARQAKAIAEQQSAFAEEQIHLALDATAHDLERYLDILASMPTVSATHDCKTLSKRQEFYNTLQKELILLTSLASRLTALRKEIVKTEVRISRKNKLFEKLSELGDKVFPKRKDAIKVMSDAFLLDMQHFAKESFAKGLNESGNSFYGLRDEIKNLQASAKALTLNTHAFTEARIILSECWDKLKETEKERKKAFAVRKQANLEKMQEAKQKIQELAVDVEKASVNLEESIRRSEEILHSCKTWQASKEEFKELKDLLFEVRKPLLDKAKQEEIISKERVRQEIAVRQEKIQHISAKIKELIDNSQIELDRLLEERELMTKQMELLGLSRIEKSKIDPLLRQLRHCIALKKEEMMEKKSASAWQSLHELKGVLEEKKQERSEIRNQLDHYRKAAGSSGLDFEKAMIYQEMIENEKIRLEKINKSIDQIIDRIDELEG